jgi:hypothetical protein
MLKELSHKEVRLLTSYESEESMYLLSCGIWNMLLKSCSVTLIVLPPGTTKLKDLTLFSLVSVAVVYNAVN